MASASLPLSTTSSLENTENSRLLNLKEDIKNAVCEYDDGCILKIPSKIRKNLKDRFTLTWGAKSKMVVPSTKWRNDRARDVYLEVQDLYPHLFVAFVSVVLPTICSRPDFYKVVADLLLLEKGDPVQLNLNTEARDFLKSVAAEGKFTDDSRFIKFFKALFPKDSQDLGILGQLPPSYRKHPCLHDETRHETSRKRPRVLELSSLAETSKNCATPTESQSALIRGPA
ncbi:hypothetical protein V500_00978 [Pseudogymnoascus sp. VKM F-4518 (FW-2643)]|nr:hypothetical protein V500_00978 [Pseudogymnoascus sp. VKM F-4518 (FW-2643)]